MNVILCVLVDFAPTQDGESCVHMILEGLTP
jgi:hypothetical protein